MHFAQRGLGLGDPAAGANSFAAEIRGKKIHQVAQASAGAAQVVGRFLGVVAHLAVAVGNYGANLQHSAGGKYSCGRGIRSNPRQCPRSAGTQGLFEMPELRALHGLLDQYGALLAQRGKNPALFGTGDLLQAAGS
ncbi:MAG TPA: hypothetical protein PLS59_07960 [Kiritimatiellia bacterium]|nr:hypothetical protein [Kiritimatiellia bacterium]